MVRRHFKLARFSCPAMIVALVIAGTIPSHTSAQIREASEYEVKALFLYNFAKFVEWPPNTSRQLSDPMTICVFGEDPFGPILDDAVRGKRIGSHKFVIRRIQAAQSANGCQIAFISTSERKHVRSVLATVGGEGVLTVGEMDDFAAIGGVINLVIEAGRVHFEVNVDAAERAGLKISSKLLTLAKIVKEVDHAGKS